MMSLLHLISNSVMNYLLNLGVCCEEVVSSFPHCFESYYHASCVKVILEYPV